MASARFGALVRQLSTSAVRGNLVRAPIQLFGMEGRYAHALYSAASKEKNLDAVEKELSSFRQIIQKDAKLAEFVSNPTIKRTEKKVVMAEVMKKLKYSNVTTNLFLAMAENGRLSKIKSILNAFNKIMSAHRGEVVCVVTTAKPLDAAHQKELKTALQAFLKQGQSLSLETQVDPSLIGGMVVNIGEKYVDMSMATKIKTYTNLIKEAV